MAEIDTENLTVSAGKWQKLLRLEDWEIGVGLGDKKTMQNQIGSISYVRETGQALITVLNKKQADLYPWTFDEEVALVRKLLDLRFEMVTCDETARPYFERALRILAELLVALDKKARETKKETPRQMPRVIEG